MTRIHNIGHIHNANFVQTQFSTSHPQKQHFLKSWKFTFLWKYSVCGLKFEISEYPIKLPYVTYSPYKYELERMKTHEMRAKNFPEVFFPSTVGIRRCVWNNAHMPYLAIFSKSSSKNSIFEGFQAILLEKLNAILSEFCLENLSNPTWHAWIWLPKHF